MFVSIVSLLYRNKQKSKRYSLIESMFWYFFQKISKQFVSVVSLFYETVSFDVLIEPKPKPKPNQNSLIESIFCYFSSNLGLFRFVWKQLCLFLLFQYRFETLKQTNFFLLLVLRNKPKHNPNRSGFDLFRFEPNFFFPFEDTLGEVHLSCGVKRS
jgi:hypothetical protein